MPDSDTHDDIDVAAGGHHGQAPDTSESSEEVAAVVGTDTAQHSKPARFLRAILRGVGAFIHFMLFLPAFMSVFLLFTIFQLSVDDMRWAFVSVGAWDLALIDVVYVSAGILGFAELVEVSEAGVDKTKRCQAMMWTWIILGLALLLIETVLSIIRWTLNIHELWWAGTYSNFGFLGLVILFGVQSTWVSFRINSNTLMRHIGKDYSAA